MMKVQVNTDDNVQGDEGLADWVEKEVENALSHFQEQITRVEVHLSDENAAKAGGGDKRCLMEARPTGMLPIAVTHEASSVGAAVTGAAKKLKAALTSSLGRRNDQKGSASIRKSEDG
jgi:ribosome-associated translation inhibitor RaiA